jgi:succinyl-diaminopimelate desuccinylase
MKSMTMTTQELIDKTRQLIAIPSTADNLIALRHAVTFVAEIVEQACPDVTIERFESNGKLSFLAYRGKMRPKKFKILLNAHLDVVPALAEQYVAWVEDGRLYGRGALDMKGTALALTDVFCEMVNKVPYDLGLQIVCDEEVGGANGVQVQIGNGIRADFVIMGEYSNHPAAIYNAARGLCWLEISFKGRTSHGAHLWHGDNAVVRAGVFASAVLKRYPTPDKETWTTTASIASLSTPNETYNKVPDTAVLKIDFRFTQEDEVFKNRESVQAFIESIDPSAELVNIVVFDPAVNVEELNPFVQGLSHAVRQAFKKEPQFLGRPGASDGRLYAQINNDIVEFGLYGHGQHSDEEYVELSSFDEYREAMRIFLQNPTKHTTRAASPRDKAKV